jgi:foldase protein PrsA
MKRLIMPAMLAIALILAAAPVGCAKRAVAKVDGEAITEQEFVNKLEDTAGRQVLDRLILERLIEIKAKQKNVTVSDAEINRSLEGGKQRIGAANWKQYLDSTGQSEASIKHDLKINLMLRKLVTSEKQIKEYYDQNRTRFDVPPQVTYRRVILKDKAEAEAVRQQIVSGKLTLADAVREKSIPEDPLKQRGGEVGPLPEGVGDPNVIKVLPALKVGEISEPVEAAYPRGSFQLVELLNRTPGKQRSLEEVRDEVTQAYMAAHSAEVSQFINDLRANAKVTVFDPRFKGLAEQYAKLKERKPPAISIPRAPSGPRPGAAAPPATAPAHPPAAPAKEPAQTPAAPSAPK